jgi:hypothetical protein
MSKLTLEQQLHHLGYEWWMFRTTHFLLARLPHDDDPVRNALIESMALHGRVLFYFFFEKPKDDDFGVEHLGIGRQGTIEPILSHWKLSANKYVAHLTETRRKPQIWDAGPVVAKLQSLVDEVRAHLGPRLPEDWIGDRPPHTNLLALTTFGSTVAGSSFTGATGPSGSSSTGATGPSGP